MNNVNAFELQNCSDFELKINANFIQQFIDAFDYPLNIDLSSGANEDVEIQHVLGTPLHSTHKHTQSKADNAYDYILTDVLPHALAHPSENNESNWESNAIGHHLHRAELSNLNISLLNPPKIFLNKEFYVNDLNLKLSFDLDLKLRFFKKWFSKSVFVDDCIITGCNAKLHFSQVGQTTYLLPELSNVKVSTKLKLLKWRFRIKLDLTKSINQRLRNLAAFELFNFDKLCQKSLHYKGINLPEFGVTSFTPTLSNSELKVACNFRVQKVC